MTTTITPDLIEDRFDGAMFAMMDRRGDPNSSRNYATSTSELYDRLDDVLTELVFDLCRHDLEDPVEAIVVDLHAVIRDYKREAVAS